MKLMVPGPAETWPEDLAEMARPVMPHYGEAFLEVWRDVRRLLGAIWGTRAEVIMIPGPGTAGTEMAVCGFARKKCIAVRCGAFSDRMIEILQAHRADVVDLCVPDRQAVSADRVADALREHPDAAAVCMVHSESATGTLHPVAEVAAVVRQSEALLVVDAVSSMGAVDFQMDRTGVDICWTASQKALGCPPGMAMVAINQRAWDFLAGNADNITGYVLNPLTWKWHVDNWAWHPYPTSLPTPVFATMRKTLTRMVSMGLDAFHARQARAADMVRKGCRAVGFELYPESDQIASPTVTALIPPPGLDEEAFRNSMLADHGVMIAGGFGDLRGRIVRIGHMGPGTEDSHILATLNAVECAARKHGVECPRGAAVAAACG